MTKILTFIDANVLIAAATGKSRYSLPALTILSDPQREFASSPFIRLEVLPKAIFHRQQIEAEFYEAYFASVAVWQADLARLVTDAEIVGGKFGLNLGDALHVAAALSVQADEFITAERPTSPLKNVTGVRVTTIYKGQ